MNARSLLPTIGLVATTALLAATPAAGQGTVSEGDRPSYTFRNSLVNGLGSKSLDDFRGKVGPG